MTMKFVTYPIASTRVALTGCNVTPAQDGYTQSVQDWSNKLQCSAKSTHAFFANNGFFSIKSQGQGVNMHVCINQGITATSMNLMLNAQHSFWHEQCPTCMLLLQCCVCQLYLGILYWLFCLQCSSATFLECSYQYCMHCCLLAM